MTKKKKRTKVTMIYATFISAFDQTPHARNESSIHIRKCALQKGKKILKTSKTRIFLSA